MSIRSMGSVFCGCTGLVDDDSTDSETDEGDFDDVTMPMTIKQRTRAGSHYLLTSPSELLNTHQRDVRTQAFDSHLPPGLLLPGLELPPIPLRPKASRSLGASPERPALSKTRSDFSIRWPGAETVPDKLGVFRTRSDHSGGSMMGLGQLSGSLHNGNGFRL